VARLLAQEPSEAWAPWLYRLAGQTLGIAGELQVNSELESLTLTEIAVLRWISILRKELVRSALVTDGFATLDRELPVRCLANPVEPRDTAEAAVVWVALRTAATARLESAIAETLQLNRPERDAVALVENICRRFPLFARQLNMRYEGRPGFRIKDEYDVQDLLHALLLLHFDDIRVEEVMPSYAGNSSRMDFLLKSEKLVVEAKMTRKTLGQKDVADQLIEDKERYRTHPDCRTLVCFVYDPDGHCDNPVALEKDVSATSGGLQVVVIVAPRGF
jgi:hypothetical protein